MPRDLLIFFKFFSQDAYQPELVHSRQTSNGMDDLSQRRRLFRGLGLHSRLHLHTSLCSVIEGFPVSE